jgi:uncharacterized protein YxjI
MFTKSTYLVREHVGLLKFANTYDILEADTGTLVAVAQEKPGWLVHLLRFAINKQALPTHVFIAPRADAAPVISIHRGISLLGAKIAVRGADGRDLGYFKSKLFSLGGGFRVFDHAETQVAEVKGDWKGWNFKYLDAAGQEIGTVTKKWGGLGKELFTSADNYVINVAAGQSQEFMVLLLAAGIAIDTIYKER